MNSLIFGTLAFLLFFSQTAFAQKWELLDPEVVDSSDPPTARTLLNIATAYVKQKGEFESTKSPFPGNDYDVGNDDTTFERRNTSTLTYYRYNFTLKEQFGNATVNATATVSYNPSNSNFVVTNYNYRINYQGQEPESDHGTPGYNNALVDVRTLTGDGDLASDVTDSFNRAIADHIEFGSLPDAEYSIDFIYGAWMQQFDGDAETNFNEEGEISGEGEFSEEQTEEDEEQPLISLEEGEGDDEIVEEADIILEEGEGDGRIAQEEEEAIVDDEEASGPLPGYKVYLIDMKVKSSQGKYYYMVLEVHYTKENGEFVLDKSDTMGTLKSLESTLL